MSSHEQKPPKLEPVQVHSHLTYKEEAAYRVAVREKEFPLTPQKQAQLFELYLNGMTCEQIIGTQPPGIRLGAVVRACVEGDWYNKRQSYLNQLLNNVKTRVAQVQSESVNFAADLLAAAHKQHGRKLKKYLETGEEKALGDFAISNLTQYQKAASLLLSLTGQDKGNGKPLSPEQGVSERAVTGTQPFKKNDDGTIDGELVESNGEELGLIESLMRGPPTPEMAEAMIRALHEGKVK